MGKRTKLPEQESNLLLTSVLILLISIILAACAYFAFTLGILDPPATSDAPSRLGSGSAGTGIASPDGAASSQQGNGDTIYFPGFVDFSINDGISSVTLSNDSRNTVSFNFTLTDQEGQTLYYAESVQPGQSDSWEVTSSFDPGTGSHQVTVRVDAYLVSDGTQCNGITSTFVVDMG